jgi:predicted MPP superfamily phosphohydrolase
LGIGLMQAILLLAHWFIFHTLIVFFAMQDTAVALALRCALLVLGFSFVAAALLSYRFFNPLVIGIYRIAAVWLGFLNYLFFASCLCWFSNLALLLSPFAANRAQERPAIATVLFACACLISLYGLLNALWIRVRRISVSLPNLPASWRGRTAVLVSDLHLGHVNGAGFSRRVARIAATLKPDIVLAAGDFFDGTRVAPTRMAAPFRALTPPLGMYFSTGNHDEYGDLPRFLDALKENGVRVLHDEMVEIDGLNVVGISYRTSTHLLQMRAKLEALHLDRSRPSILISHVPNRLPLAEQAGVSLQVSGHTHGGQIFPFTWFTRRAFGKFTHGLHQFGAMQVYTSYGVGTWGPPMRVGTSPEIVVLEFQQGNRW